MATLERAVQDKLARQVKLADVADNMNLSRIPNPTPRDYDRFEEYITTRREIYNVGEFRKIFSLLEAELKTGLPGKN